MNHNHLITYIPNYCMKLTWLSSDNHVKWKALRRKQISQLSTLTAATESGMQVPDVAYSKQGQEVLYGLYCVLYTYFTTPKLYSYVPDDIQCS